jgi:CRP-like cAMP-binding protein
MLEMPWFNEALFFTSEIIMLVSYLPSRMLWLRTLACIADVGFIAATVLIGLSSPGMLPTALFAFLSLVINAYYIYKLSFVYLPCRVPPGLRSLHQVMFPELTPMEFRLVLNASETHSGTDAQLISRGEVTPLILVTSGAVDIRLQNKAVSGAIEAPAILGEVSYLTSQPSIADVHALGEVEYVVLEKEKAEKALSAYEETRLKFVSTLIRSLAKKLARQNEALTGVANEAPLESLSTATPDSRSLQFAMSP